MKRLISVIVFILIGTVLAEGEEMKFVTVLSSPVGTFAQLETANPTRAVQSPVVNFGTSRVSTGRIELKGAAGYIEDLSLQSGTELGGNAGAYRVAEGMEVGSGGRITGGRLMANEVDFSGALEGKSEVKGSLYTDEIAVAGAKADSLTIPEEVELTASSGSSETLEWSNEYNCDYEVGEVVEGSGQLEVKEVANPYGDCVLPYTQGNSQVLDSCNGSFSKYDYEAVIAQNPTRQLKCQDIVLTKLSGPDRSGAYPHYDWLNHPEKLQYYYPGNAVVGGSHYSKPTCTRETEVQKNKDCPGVAVSSNAPYYMQNMPDPSTWESNIKSKFNITRDNFLDYYSERGTSNDSIIFRCMGPCAAGYVYQNGYPVSAGDNMAYYFFPEYTWNYKVKCYLIDYIPPSPSTKAKCKEGSPKYDSYLLKSKSTTSSSGSKEEGTEG